VDVTLPHCCRAPHPTPLTRPHRERFSPLPAARAGAGGAYFTRSGEPRVLLVALVRTRAPLVLVCTPCRAKPTAGDSGARAPPLAAGRTRLLESTGPGFSLTYVAYVCFNCFRRFRCMLQLFHFDVAKVDHGDVEDVANVLDECCKCLFKMFHLFQVYVASVFLSICCTCFNGCTRMLQASVPNVSSAFSDVCCKCAYLDVAYVSHICCKSMFKMF